MFCGQGCAYKARVGALRQDTVGRVRRYGIVRPKVDGQLLHGPGRRFKFSIYETVSGERVLSCVSCLGHHPLHPDKRHAWCPSVTDCDGALYELDAPFVA
jgi:hypothetical protein